MAVVQKRTKEDEKDIQFKTETVENIVPPVFNPAQPPINQDRNFFQPNTIGPADIGAGRETTQGIGPEDLQPDVPADITPLPPGVFNRSDLPPPIPPPDVTTGSGGPSGDEPRFPGEVITQEFFSPSAVDPRTLQKPTGPNQIVTGINLAEQAEAQRLAAFNRASGAEGLVQDLQRDIENPRSLAPGGFGRFFSGQIGGGGGINTPIERTLTGLAIGGIALGAAAFFGFPALASVFTGGKISAALSANALSIKGAITLTGLNIARKTVNEALQNSKKISVLKGDINTAAQLASTTLTAVTYGMDPILAIDSLSASVDAINEAESKIRQLAIYNINFRLSNAHIELQQTIKQKRQEILERVLAIQNVASTGKSNADPEGLMLSLLELEKLEPLE